MDFIIPFEKMSKFSLSVAEREKMSDRVAKLLQSYEVLEKIDTDNVERLVTVLEERNVLREDEAIKKFTRDELLACAPEEYDGYFQVPKTLE